MVNSWTALFNSRTVYGEQVVKSTSWGSEIHMIRAHLTFLVYTNLTVYSLVHKEVNFLELLGYLLWFMR